MEKQQFCRWCRAEAKRCNIGWFGSHVDVEGEQIHYVEAGDGETLLLLHGFTGWSYSWRLNLPILAQHMRVIAPDLRGFGLSEKNDRRGHSLVDQVEVVRRLMDVMGVERAIIGGHSMGGEIALRFALKYPDRVRALIIVASAGYLTWRPSRLERLALGIPGLSRLFIRLTVFRRSFVRRSLTFLRWNSHALNEWEIQAYMLPARAPGAVATFLRILQDMDFGATAHLLPTIEHPALIIWGESDRFIPLTHGERLTSELRQSRLITFSKCGHLPQEECAERFNQAVLEFIYTLQE